LPVAAAYNLVKEIVFPSICYLCSSPARTGMPLCADCLAKFDYLGESRCDICGEAFAGGVAHLCADCLDSKPKFAKARAFVKFSEPATRIVHAFKYQRGFHYLDWMVAGMLEVFKREFAGEKFDLLIPMSLHWRRLMARGYNQALILARPLSRKLRIPLEASVLNRAKNNPPQVGLSKAERRENLKKVFEVTNRKTVEDKTVLLVDDVITTGATANEAARALRKAGAEKVCVLAFARA
jgi:ComF family protein